MAKFSIKVSDDELSVANLLRHDDVIPQPCVRGESTGNLAKNARRLVLCDIGSGFESRWRLDFCIEMSLAVYDDVTNCWRVVSTVKRLRRHKLSDVILRLSSWRSEGEWIFGEALAWCFCYRYTFGVGHRHIRSGHWSWSNALIGEFIKKGASHERCGKISWSVMKTYYFRACFCQLY